MGHPSPQTNCDVHLNKTKLVAIKNDKVILEGTRKYADGLWDIPVHKQYVTTENYKQPHIHPGLYKDRTTPKVDSIITTPKRPSKSKDLRLPKEYRYFDELIEDNIDYISIDKQVLKDKASYAPVTINNPSMAVIIQKKKTHLELVQYLHAA